MSNTKLHAYFLPRMHLVEETTNVTLVVLRSRGTFGEVSVFCFAQSLADGAIRGQDFNFEPRVRGS